MKIKIKDLAKVYGKKKALHDINLEIEEGMFGLLGPNGAGKTTLMRIIATLLQPTSGEVLLGDRPQRKRDKFIRENLGYLPQEFSFYPNLRVYETMDYLAILQGIPAKVRRGQITRLLEQVNLWEHRNIKNRALSGGMKRRLGIAQALLNDPKILIVDEPTAGLDPEERVRFRNLLSDFAVDRTVILSTHIVGDIEFACERLAILRDGEISFAGKVKELVRMADGLVWGEDIDRREIDKVRNTYQVISYVSEGDRIRVRLISEERPGPKASRLEPTIEDAYMGLMGGII